MHLKRPAEGSELSSRPEFQAATLVVKAGSYSEAENIIQSDIYWKEDIVRFCILNLSRNIDCGVVE